jgi:hypothetical protein
VYDILPYKQFMHGRFRFVRADFSIICTAGLSFLLTFPPPMTASSHPARLHNFRVEFRLRAHQNAPVESATGICHNTMQKIVVPGHGGVQTDITDRIDKDLLISRMGSQDIRKNINFLTNFIIRLNMFSGPSTPDAVLDYLTGQITRQLHAHLSDAWREPASRKRPIGAQENPPCPD